MKKFDPSINKEINLTEEIKKLRKELKELAKIDVNKISHIKVERIITETEKRMQYLHFLYYWLYHTVHQNDIHRSLLKKIHVINYSKPDEVSLALTKRELLYSLAFCERWIVYFKHKLVTLEIRKINDAHFKNCNHYLRQFIHLHTELLNWIASMTKKVESTNNIKYDMDRKNLNNTNLITQLHNESTKELQPIVFKQKQINSTPSIQVNDITNEDVDKILDDFAENNDLVSSGDMEAIFDNLEEKLDDMEVINTKDDTVIPIESKDEQETHDEDSIDANVDETIDDLFLDDENDENTSEK